jgi:hypothetical protein
MHKKIMNKKNTVQYYLYGTVPVCSINKNFYFYRFNAHQKLIKIQWQADTKYVIVPVNVKSMKTYR